MIYLAPIQGTTDRIYRTWFPVFFKGVDLAVAPFITPAKNMSPEKNVLRELNLDGYAGIPTIPQIMSSNPDDFVKLANILHDMGYETVNWNIGCPFRIVVKKGRGAGMLCYPAKVESFLEKAIPAIKPRLSIKLRIGLKNHDEILDLLPIFNRFPLDELIIHPRTGEQMYTGEVDLDMCEKCLSLTQHRVVYNGDIDSLDKFKLLSARFGSIDRWMIGRGLLANPFLAEEIKLNIDKSYDEKLRIVRAFHDRLFEEYSKILFGPSHITNKMKEIWTYLGGFFKNGAKMQKKIFKTHHRDNYVDVVNKAFDELI